MKAGTVNELSTALEALGYEVHGIIEEGRGILPGKIIEIRVSFEDPSQKKPQK